MILCEPNFAFICKKIMFNLIMHIGLANAVKITALKACEEA